ncbi:Protein-L-isoaspartate(D-aspartate) O-methyltransferase [Elaphomyces granulatus]|jgi:protein-L-isoaspartate(D-aspartate) O-methyltransferase
MAWFCSGSTNSELVENLYNSGLIKNDRVKKAMLGVDRANYALSNPYDDSPQPIGYGATISAPHMHGYACEYLIDFLHPSSRVLDVGSGSGYLTHVLANLITDSSSLPGDSVGHAVGVDHIRELVDMARNNMRKSADGRKFIESGKVKFITGDGRLGWKDGAPYDVIHVGAAAKSVPPTLIEQLRAPGRMFIPVESESHIEFGDGQHIWVVDKKEDGSVSKEKIFGVNYVPLTDPPKR